MTKLKRPSKKAAKTTEKTAAPNVDYEQLGRMMVTIVESGYMNRKRLLKMSFVRGLVAGLGGVIGATIVVAVLIWIFSLLGEVPLIGRLFENLKDSIESR